MYVSVCVSVVTYTHVHTETHTDTYIYIHLMDKIDLSDILLSSSVSGVLVAAFQPMVLPEVKKLPILGESFGARTTAGIYGGVSHAAGEVVKEMEGVLEFLAP